MMVFSFNINEALANTVQYFLCEQQACCLAQVENVYYTCSEEIARIYGFKILYRPKMELLDIKPKYEDITCSVPMPNFDNTMIGKQHFMHSLGLN